MVFFFLLATSATASTGMLGCMKKFKARRGCAQKSGEFRYQCAACACSEFFHGLECPLEMKRYGIRQLLLACEEDQRLSPVQQEELSDKFAELAEMNETKVVEIPDFCKKI